MEGFISSSCGIKEKSRIVCAGLSQLRTGVATQVIFKSDARDDTLVDEIKNIINLNKGPDEKFFVRRHDVEISITQPTRLQSFAVIRTI